jgi:molybdopterin-guanine dinucleotide biosynthesis protein A
MADRVYDAVVLAGGSASRMGGTEKTALLVAGRSLLDRVLAAVPDARTVIVVGDQRPTVREVTWTREQPPGTGPAAAVRAGLELVSAGLTVLLAGDLPLLSSAAVDRLLAAAGPAGAVFLDGDDREQWLASAWPTEALRRADLRPGGSLRAALGPLHPTRVPADGLEVLDCDTPQDLARARELA